MKYTLVNGDNYAMFKSFIRSYQEGEMAEINNRIAVGAVDDHGVACGVMIVMILPGYAGVGWVYVAPAYRRRGVAGGFIDFLLENGKDMGVDHIFSEYQVKDEDYLFAMDRIFLSRGSTLRCNRWYYYCLPMKKIKGTEFAKQAKGVDPSKFGVVPLDRVPGTVLAAFTERIPYIKMDEYDKQISAAVIVNRVVGGVLLVRRSSEKLVTIEMLEARKGNQQMILYLLMQGYKNLREEISAGRMSENVKVEFCLDNIKSSELPRKLLGLEPTSIVDIHTIAMKLGGE